MKRRVTCLTAIATVAILGGCGDGGTDDANVAPGGSGADVGPGGPDGGGGSGGDIGDTRAALRPLGDRDVFFTQLRGALSAQGGAGGTGVDYPSGGPTEDLDGSLTDGGAVADAPAPSEAAGGATAGGGAGGNFAGGPVTAESDAAGNDGGRLEVTETNVQERGVDEEDRVKVSSDGTRLYVLRNGHDDVYPTEPVVIEDVETGEPIEIETGDVAIDPVPGYLPRSRTTLRILGLEAASAEATALRDVEIDLGGRQAQGLYLHESDAGPRVLLTSSGGGYAYTDWSDSYSYGGLDAAITRIDVADPDTAAIDARVRLDGRIVSSRRIGKHLFVASRFYPRIPGPQPWELSPEDWRAAVESADEADLLPGYTLGEDGERRPLVEPERCFVAERPANQPWYAPDIVTLAVIDLDTMALADSECYLGASETLYASPEAVYLATTRWDHGGGGFVDGAADGGFADGPAPLPLVVPEDGEGAGGTGGGDGDDIAIPYEPRVETDIHQFDIDGGTLAYRGSGTVRGHLGFDALRKPFRMSARGGDLRVASVNETFGFDGQTRTDVSPITLTVLRPDGDGALERVAELPNGNRPAFIGKPGEQLYASRFVGDRAYLVTFRQTDPLYVIDLADPEDPEILGELEIEGYSDYLLPIDDDHLLGIGRDAVAAPGGGRGERGAFVLGVKLSLFDVGDPGAPREVGSVVVGQRGTESGALFDHRGITVQRATDAHPTRVSFGIDVAGRPNPTERPDPAIGLAYYDWTYTGLHGFDVRGGDDAGIEPRGAMIVERRGDDGRFYPSVGSWEDRAVMVDDATYYVHGGEVFASRWDDLANPGEPR